MAFSLVNGTRQLHRVYLRSGHVDVPAGGVIPFEGSARTEFEAHPRHGAVLVEGGGEVPAGMLSFVEPSPVPEEERIMQAEPASVPEEEEAPRVKRVALAPDHGTAQQAPHRVRRAKT